ncbi:hypothetical protein QQS21_001995 [Conoideocrella luteorostrata]|uniref:Xylanolytic transcriptional activator regulatory domain-containing protein n=1 Tax=Conoideocrella luteorostrata TaxID=1105319 RepID=A0AAJ0G1J3_9HYPO|nr:hypothetical protein QQS21_001995 [Conoideocrella luteorostrata]
MHSLNVGTALCTEKIAGIQLVREKKEEENARLRQETEALRSAPRQRQRREEHIHVNTPSSMSPVSYGELLPEDPDTSAPLPPDRGHDVASDSLVAAESNKIDFHGPTSAIFDGEQSVTRQETLANQADVSVKAQLLAEAARQRQLEPINFRSNKFYLTDIDPSLGMNLLSIFWNRQHATGSIVYRPSFMRDMACRGPYFSPLLLNAMFFHASKNMPGAGGTCAISDNCNPGHKFRQKVEDALFDRETRVLCKSSIPTIQALLLMSDALFSWCDERSLSWHYLGIATNMIIDLGIHSETSTLASRKPLLPEDVEIRRRVFWSAFVLDKVQSIYQGRPARIRDMDSSVPMLFLDEYEELELFDSLGYSEVARKLHLPAHSVSTFVRLCTLSTIADRILATLYTEKSLQRDNDELYRESTALHGQLVQWRESLPEHLKMHFDDEIAGDTSGGLKALPHTLSLILLFHALVILLHRPFVSEGHLSSATRSSAHHAFSICEDAASHIDIVLRRYKKHWCIKSPPYFLSYATYVSATIHVRIAAQRPRAAKAHERLRNCLEILSEHQTVCRAPKRSLDILIRLTQRLGVHVGDAFVCAGDSGGRSSALIDGGASGKEHGHHRHRDTLHEAPSRRLRSQDKINAAGGFSSAAGDSTAAPTFHPDSANAPSTFSSDDLFGQTDSAPHPTDGEMDGLFAGMNFDFDPLFGFDMDQADFLQDITF